LIQAESAITARTAADRQVDAEHPIGADDGDGLAEHGKPAQAHDGLEAQAAFALPQPIRDMGATADLTIVDGGHSSSLTRGIEP
jgi:hypothetical protein